ncbi:YlaF family protein [Bacillus sp. B15-48]|uniref:YlaF family protein n=1 Tax=Bacillus sp. B15-48 TaxID=1548601 RepID=UPI00193FBBFA|nr:YlaF family protein [Bacillus sp. B15-48]MBM4764368.1 hypothetical protein [Bacillus sp. B15-48]
MKQIKWGFLLLAIAAAASMMGIGVAIGESSILGAVISVIALSISMGYGFKMKKRMQENGEL